jgi:flagellin
MRVNQNITAYNAYRNLSASNTSMSKSLEKLSSGTRINRAADDAAGLVISQGLRAQVGGLTQATRNAQDGISVVQTAEGALNEVHNMLGRMRDLAVQASNDGSNDSAAVTAAQNEVDELAKEIDDISKQTKFGGTSLLDGSYSGKNFQVGANNGDVITVSITDQSANTLLGGASVTLGSGSAIDTIDTAIATVSATRGTLGATQNRLESRISNLQVATENLSASESRIRDTDYAAEMVKFTRGQIMNQVGTSMLAQANQLPQGVLSLVRG